jgi:outer membrane protein OmpA-like peptidoglycan-associated protein
MRKLALCVVLLVWGLMPNPLMAAEKQDVLDIASGAVVLTATSEYNESWAALLLLNGTPDTGWCSAESQAYPNTIMMELSRPFQLQEFVIDNSKAQESGYPGISARKFELYASTKSRKEGFDLVYSGEAAKGERKVFTLDKPAKAQWLKLVVLSNWGNPAYTEIMELEAYGETVGAAPEQRSVSGFYDTNYNLLRLEQYGSTIEGCYDWDNGTLSGTTDGRVIRFQWIEDGPETGAAVMVLTADGNFLNGLWYEEGTYRGLWYGTKVTDGRQPQCVIQKDAVGRSLDTVGRAIVYGIYFDFDSATLKTESTETLEQILKAVQSRPSLKLTIEGHTDSQGSDEYNLKLSQQRAQAVVDWLVQKGVAASRLNAKGYGESRPVADNNRPDGRALNRRVEIAAVK